jgi:hypothetical protein
MHGVAASGCPETLRSLFTVIGLADERRQGLGELLFGAPDACLDLSG